MVDIIDAKDYLELIDITNMETEAEQQVISAKKMLLAATSVLNEIRKQLKDRGEETNQDRQKRLKEEANKPWKKRSHNPQNTNSNGTNGSKKS